MSPRDEHHLQDDLEAMADGGHALSPARREALQQHIDSCGACQSALQNTQAALAALHSEGLQPSAGFDAALYAKLDAIDAIDAQGPASFWASVRQFLTPPRIYALGAVAAVTLVVIAASQPWHNAGPEAPAPLAQAELLELARDQQMYESLELLRDLDMLEDLEVIEALDLEEG